MAGASIGQIALVDGVVDLDSNSVRRATVVSLTRIETALLAYLSARIGCTVSQEELLREVWGYGAGTRTRTVQVTVRRVREKIELDPSEPVHLLTAWGSGYRLEPAKDPAFIGRLEPLGELAALAAAGQRAVVITGPGGVGKSSLALHFAAMQHGREVRICHAESAIDEAELVHALAEALRVATAGTLADQITAIGRALEALDGPLLVVDNLEQLPDPAVVLDRLREMAPEALILATSRSPVGMEQEVVVRLEGLGEADGVRLVIHRAGRSAPSDPDAATALGAMVHALDGLPLALELSAARLAVMSPEALVARIGTRLSVVRDPSRSGRHDAMERVLEVSWELLEPAAQVALTRLSLWVAGFDLAVGEPVLDDLGEPADLVDTLLRASLIHRVGSEWGPRFQLYGVVRTFAAARLRNREAIEARTAIALIEACERALGGQTFSEHHAPQVIAETNNLLAARAWVPDGELAGRLAGVLWPALHLRWPLTYIHDVMAELIPRTESGSVLEAQVRIKHAKLAIEAEAVEDLAEAEAIAREHQRIDLVGWVEFRRASRRRNAAELAHACQHIDRALDHARTAGDGRLEGRCVGMRGIVAFEAGDAARGEADFRTALAMHRDAGDHWAISIRLSNLTVALMRRCAWKAAGQCISEARAELFGTDDTLFRGYEAKIALHHGEHARAATILHEVSRTLEKMAVGGQAAAFRTLAARAELEHGDTQRALRLFAEARLIAHRVADRRTEGTVRAAEVWALLEAGNHSEARDTVAQARTIGESFGAPDLLSEVLGAEAAVQLLVDRDASAAAASLTEARALAKRVGELRGLAVHTVWSAIAERLAGNEDRTEILAAQAQTRLRAVGHPSATALTAAAMGVTPAPGGGARSVDLRLLRQVFVTHL